MTIENTMKPLTEEMITFINNVQSNWVAGHHERFTTLNDVVPLLGSRTTPTEKRAPVKNIEPLTDLPEEFDPRTKWPKCESLFEVRD
jgi:hypothetical protein